MQSKFEQIPYDSIAYKTIVKAIYHDGESKALSQINSQVTIIASFTIAIQAHQINFNYIQLK